MENVRMTNDSPFHFIVGISMISTLIVMYINGNYANKLLSYVKEYFPEVLLEIKPNQILQMTQIKKVLIKDDGYMKFNNAELTQKILLYKKSKHIFTIFFSMLFLLIFYGFIKELEGPHWRESLIKFGISFIAPVMVILILVVFKK